MKKKTMMEITVEEGNKLCVFGSVNDRVGDVLAKVFKGVAQYCSYMVKGEGGKWYSGASYCEGDVEGCVRAYDVRLRPAATLLRLLGRMEEGWGDDERVGGLREVRLKECLHEQAAATPDRLLIVAAATIQETLDSSPPPYTGATNASAIWGPATFSLTLREAAHLESTARIVCDPLTFPPPFYIALTSRTTKHISYYSTRRVQPLSVIGTYPYTKEVETMLQECKSRSESELASLLETPCVLPANPVKSDVDEYEVWAARVDNARNRLEGTEVEIRQLEYTPKFDAEHQEFVANVRRDYESYGFTNLAHAERTLAMSLNELSSSVCQSVHGHFMVDGSNGCINQLCEKTQVPITFLSAAGIDFCSDFSTDTEGAKYFTRSPSWTPADPLSEKYKAWKDDTAQQSLYDRVKSLYTCIFRAAEVQKVMYPCMLQMGLGVFLANVPDECKVSVRKTYVKAQVDLLKERSWGFEAYLLNAGPPALAALAKEAIEEAGTEGLTCPIVLHSRDVKFISMSLAAQGFSAGYLNPSDEIAVLQGCIGYYWELGRGSRYVGEEDFAATSTAILSHTKISSFHTDPSRVMAA